MLRIVVAAPPRVRRKEDLAARLPACADVIELRLDLLADYLQEGDLARWIEASPRPVLATLRSLSEGGAFEGDPSEAAERLLLAARAGARYLDVEIGVAPHLTSLPPGVEVVVAHHGQEDVCFPTQVAGREVAYWKLARPVAEHLALRVVVDEAEATTRVPRTVVPYGPLGSMRGALCPRRGLLYGSWEEGESVVEGQPSLLSLLDELRAGEVGPRASLYGLLGRPPSRSPSPALHNAAFRSLGLDALYVPLAGMTMEAALQLPFAGFSVTTPYKAEALGLAASADEAATAIGAANTLVRRGQDWHASNTDAEAIASSVPVGEGGGAFVYGGGGYARAAVYALRAAGYVVRVGARDAERGRAMATASGCSFVGPRFERRANDRVLLNATPAGVDGDLPRGLAQEEYTGLVVLDAPYARAGRATGLVAAARATALDIVDGRALLRAQAHGQVRAFTGRDVPDEVLALAMDPPLPLLLLGLRGAGKSTTGRRVARRLGRPFLDLDLEVERITGRSPAHWILNDGEDAFRRAEAEALARVKGRRGIVVAGGGGVLEHPAAMRLVRAHTLAAWLDVPPETAAARVRSDDLDRPRLGSFASPLEEARVLLERRAAGWQEASAFVVDAGGEAGDVAEALVKGWIAHARTPRAS